MQLSRGIAVMLILSMAAPLARGQAAPVNYFAILDGSKNNPGPPTSVSGYCFVSQNLATGQSTFIVGISDIRNLDEVHIHSGNIGSADLGANLVTLLRLGGPLTTSGRAVPFTSPQQSFNALNGYPGTITSTVAIGMVLNVDTTSNTSPSSLARIIGNPTLPVGTPPTVPTTPVQGLYCDVHTYTVQNGVRVRGASATRGQFQYNFQG